MEYQEHFGKKFYQDKKTGYWISSQCPKIRAHRWVWINTFGKIPKGCHIHHKDENKSNNLIENLQMIDASDHLRLHFTPERKEWSRNWAAEIRPLTKAWHVSEEGRAWHKFHAIKSRFGKWEPHEYECQQCKKKYLSKKKSRVRFCSNACKSCWRRKSGLDDVEKTCPSCNVVFKSNKYFKTVFCSRKCAKSKFVK